MLSAMSSSSTAFQPNFKGREMDIDAKTPEFPECPEKLSLQTTREFALKSQLALTSLDGFSSEQQSLFLPLITPHELQYRFYVEQSSVYVVMRKPYPVLKNEVDRLDMRRFRGIYVRGPVGVGKSHLLYILAAEFRLNRSQYRVTYINDCADWRRDPWSYLFNELVMTFYDDSILGKSIVEMCEEFANSYKREDLMLMMHALIDHVKSNHLQWLVICDQHNALFNPSVIKNCPFDVIDFLASHRGSNIKVIISASANNEGYPTEMQGWRTHDISSHRFDQEEFKAWCDHYWLGNNKVDHESDEAIDALFWTGGVPYELDLLWRQPAATLGSKTACYQENRVREMAFTHNKFYLCLSDQQKRNLMECVSRMVLGVAPPNITIGMDRQLLDIVKDTDGHQTIVALNPVARDALISFHGELLIDPFRLVTEVVLGRGGYFTNDTKGRSVESYITMMLEVTKRFSFQSKKTTTTGLSTTDAVSKNLDIESVIKFAGNKLPSRSLFARGLTTSFIPKSSNYPGLDFFIWNPHNETLMAFQVTVKGSFTSHPKIDGNSDNCKLWLDFCYGDLVQKPMEIYWIIPQSCVGKPKNFHDRVIILEDLWDAFPALQKLTLQ
ncbi:hypothetical protein MP638_001301 [Amoeboaphelidium occidentale]|nr:hypothetical protein MP638_001301 [Amoeboaphelidium occidentale]